MGWEWVAPAGTAAVGVTSVVVTFAASRSAQAREERSAARQRRYAVEDARREERKQVYRTFLGAVSDFENTVKCLYLASTDDDLDERTAVVDAFHVLVNLGLELDLVAGESVSQVASELVDDVEELTTVVLDDPAKGRMVHGGVTKRLIGAMAEELRLEPPTV